MALIRPRRFALSAAPAAPHLDCRPSRPNSTPRRPRLYNLYSRGSDRAVTGGYGIWAQGPIAGSVAAWLQAGIGNVGAGSVFAYLQSVGMAGYGAPVVNGIWQACAVVHGATAAWLGWK